MFSPATGYAAIALGYLAECDGAVAKVEDIAAACSIPGAYLGKIMHTLARKGFVKTRRGVGGGIMLICDPAKTVLLDLCQALDDPATDERCMLGIAPCSDERACPTHEFWVRQRAELIDFASRTNILHIGEFQRRQGAELMRTSRKSTTKKTTAKKAAVRPSSSRSRTKGGSR